MPKTGFHNRENQSVSEDLTMIKSMTGFGHAEMANDSCRITVEMKSVNNRYLDISIRMPRQLNALEGEIKKELKKYMQRGKVDVFISYEDLTDKARSVQYNRKLAEEYLRHLRQMAEDFGIPNDISVSQLSRYPDVLTMEEETADADAIWANLRGVLDKAAESFLQARIREGEFLKADILSKLDEMTGDVEFITSRSPEIIAVYRQKLYDKVRELLETASIDDARIVQETAIYADKVCVDEELVRLKSHIEATRAALDLDEGVGRKLDFIAQEMNRESNTILSKSIDLEISDHAINLKTSVEKVREQIQNIE